MPIYEYSCRKCNEIFSVFQSINAGESDTKCPACGSNDVKKRISTFACCSIGSSGDGVSGLDPSASGGGFGGGFTGG